MMPSYAFLWSPELGYSRKSSLYRMRDWGGGGGAGGSLIMVFAFKERLFALLSKITVTQEGCALTEFFTLTS